MEKYAGIVGRPRRETIRKDMVAVVRIVDECEARKWENMGLRRG